MPLFNKSLVSKLSLYLLASVLSAALGVIINPFLAINLSPNDYAIIGYYQSLNLLFLPLVSFNLISYYTRRYYKDNTDKLIKIKNTILSFQLLFGLICSALIITGFYFYAKVTELSFDIFPYIVLSVLSVFFGIFMSFLLAENRLKGNAKGFFIYSMVNVSINILLALLFVVLFKWGATGRLVGMFLTGVLAAVLAFRQLNFKFYIDKAIAVEALKFSWPVLFSAILYFVFGGYDRVLLEKLGDNETLGIYNVAFQITNYINIVGISLRQTFEPNIYKATAKNQIKKAVIIMFGVFAVMLVICFLFNFVVFYVIDILTFGKYVNAVPFAEILIYRNAAIVLAFMSSNILIGLGHPKLDLYTRILGSGFAVFGFMYLINTYQFVGAAWGQTIALLFMSLISIVVLFYLSLKKRDALKDA